MVSPLTLRQRWGAAARLVAETRDVLDARPSGDDAPAPLVARGWSAFLASLTDTELAMLEVEGHDASWPIGAPPSLLELARRVREVCAIPSHPSQSGPPQEPRACADPGPGARKNRRETPRKRAQIEAFAQLIRPLASDAARIVDVGSGHGHLTREIAEQIARPVIGLERDATLAERARKLSRDVSLSFAVTDVLLDGIPLLPGDCVIGLHACGELGDAMVESAARSGASIALVGCCLQKRRALSRRPLCAIPEIAEALDLPRSILGLSNLTARDDGVEATRAENLAGRERRLALHRLLSDGEPGLRPGAEIEGLNRRSAQRDLPSLVARAFAVRGRPPPDADAIARAAAWARVRHASSRRLSLPRAMLARLLEVFVLLDRARYLEERGYTVAIGVLFPEAASARNLALAATRVI